MACTRFRWDHAEATPLRCERHRCDSADTGLPPVQRVFVNNFAGDQCAVLESAWGPTCGHPSESVTSFLQVRSAISGAALTDPTRPINVRLSAPITALDFICGAVWVGLRDGSVYIVNPVEGNALHLCFPRAHPGEVHGFAFAPCCHAAQDTGATTVIVVSFSGDGTVLTWVAEPGSPPSVVPAGEASVRTGGPLSAVAVGSTEAVPCFVVLVEPGLQEASCVTLDKNGRLAGDIGALVTDNLSNPSESNDGDGRDPHTRVATSCAFSCAAYDPSKQTMWLGTTEGDILGWDMLRVLSSAGMGVCRHPPDRSIGRLAGLLGHAVESLRVCDGELIGTSSDGKYCCVDCPASPAYLEDELNVSRGNVGALFGGRNQEGSSKYFISYVAPLTGHLVWVADSLGAQRSIFIPSALPRSPPLVDDCEDPPRLLPPSSGASWGRLDAAAVRLEETVLPGLQGQIGQLARATREVERRWLDVLGYRLSHAAYRTRRHGNIVGPSQRSGSQRHHLATNGFEDEGEQLEVHFAGNGGLDISEGGESISTGTAFAAEPSCSTPWKLPLANGSPRVGCAGKGSSGGGKTSGYGRRCHDDERCARHSETASQNHGLAALPPVSGVTVAASPTGEEPAPTQVSSSAGRQGHWVHRRAAPLTPAITCSDTLQLLRAREAEEEGTPPSRVMRGSPGHLADDVLALQQQLKLAEQELSQHRFAAAASLRQIQDSQAALAEAAALKDDLRREQSKYAALSNQFSQTMTFFREENEELQRRLRQAEVSKSAVERELTSVTEQHNAITAALKSTPPADHVVSALRDALADIAHTWRLEDEERSALQLQRSSAIHDQFVAEKMALVREGAAQVVALEEEREQLQKEKLELLAMFSQLQHELTTSRNQLREERENAEASRAQLLEQLASLKQQHQRQLEDMEFKMQQRSHRHAWATKRLSEEAARQMLDAEGLQRERLTEARAERDAAIAQAQEAASKKIAAERAVLLARLERLEGELFSAQDKAAALVEEKSQTEQARLVLEEQHTATLRTVGELRDIVAAMEKERLREKLIWEGQVVEQARAALDNHRQTDSKYLDVERRSWAEEKESLRETVNSLEAALKQSTLEAVQCHRDAQSEMARASHEKQRLESMVSVLETRLRGLQEDFKNEVSVNASRREMLEQLLQKTKAQIAASKAFLEDRAAVGVRQQLQEQGEMLRSQHAEEMRRVTQEWSQRLEDQEAQHLAEKMRMAKDLESMEQRAHAAEVNIAELRWAAVHASVGSDAVAELKEKVARVDREAREAKRLLSMELEDERRRLREERAAGELERAALKHRIDELESDLCVIRKQCRCGRAIAHSSGRASLTSPQVRPDGPTLLRASPVEGGRVCEGERPSTSVGVPGSVAEGAGDYLMHTGKSISPIAAREDSPGPAPDQWSALGSTLLRQASADPAVACTAACTPSPAHRSAQRSDWQPSSSETFLSHHPNHDGHALENCVWCSGRVVKSMGGTFGVHSPPTRALEFSPTRKNARRTPPFFQQQ